VGEVVKGVVSKQFSEDVKNFRELFKKSQERISDKLEYFYSPYDGKKRT
jgi:predicted transcriptional regulator